jgi:hypothetical protein
LQAAAGRHHHGDGRRCHAGGGGKPVGQRQGREGRHVGGALRDALGAGAARHPLDLLLRHRQVGQPA